MNKRRYYNQIYRYIIIVTMALKFILQIYFFLFRHREWDGEARQKWDDMLRRQAVEYRIKAVRLGGVLIKVGQFLSTRTDFMPEVFIRELQGLVDRVPAGDFSHAKELMEKEWGSPLDAHLEMIGETPVASASIGEVYHGRLKDGEEVAIKVQRERVQEIFHKDFKALKMVFRLISLLTSFGKTSDLKALYRELVYVMDNELDFGQELTHGRYFREQYAGSERIRIPYYHAYLSTSRVLVMEWMEGAKITDKAFMHRHDIHPEEIAGTIFEFYFNQFFSSGSFHADPHAGNLLIQEDGAIIILDFGMIGEVHEEDLQYFKRLLRGLVISDYDSVLEALEDMDFILPHADKTQLKKMLEQLVELYRGGSFDITEPRILEQIKEDIRIFVKEQPIQLPADYAYLGRAISIVYGILLTLDPELDLKELTQPKVEEMLGVKNIAHTFYKEVVKDTAKPLLSLPQSFLEWLEGSKLDRNWDREKTRRTFMHQYYLLVEGISFMMVITGLLLSGGLLEIAGSFSDVFGSALAGISFLILLISLIKHYRWIRKQK